MSELVFRLNPQFVTYSKKFNKTNILNIFFSNVNGTKLDLPFLPLSSNKNRKISHIVDASCCYESS